MRLLRLRPATNAFRMGAFVALIVMAQVAYASSGTIDATNKYAWSNTGGFVNFAPSSSSVAVTDSALTGYAWSQNNGWINLSATNGGVKNDGAGNLSGFAWDESAGWVDFTGVTIDGNGRFHGTATGANEVINFDCSNCDVQTSWRAASANSSVVTSSGFAGQSASSALTHSDAAASNNPVVTQDTISHILSTASSILSIVSSLTASSTNSNAASADSLPQALLDSLYHVIESLLTRIEHIF